VKNRFQSLPFKPHARRYTAASNARSEKPTLLAQNAICVGDGEVQLALFDARRELCSSATDDGAGIRTPDLIPADEQQPACITNVALAYCDSGAIMMDLSNLSSAFPPGTRWGCGQVEIQLTHSA
jgi:hypothetical protein